MKSPRKAVSLSKKMNERIEKLAIEWEASESEVIRRLLGVGDFVVREVDNGAEIYSKKEKKRTKLVIPF